MKTKVKFIVVSVISIGVLLFVLVQPFSTEETLLLEGTNKEIQSNDSTSLKTALKQSIEQLRTQSEKHKKRYTDDGWLEVQPVSLSNLDKQAIDLDPSLAGVHDELLFKQLQSNSLREEQLNNAVEIFGLTHHKLLRMELIRALGRLHSSKAKESLIEIYQQAILSKDERQSLLGAVLPRSLDDESAQFLINELNNETLSHGEKTQICATLITQALISNPNEFQQTREPTAPSALLAVVHPQWHDLLNNTYQSIYLSPRSAH